MVDDGGLTYQKSGVNSQKEEMALGKLKDWVEKTFAFGLGKDSIKLGLNYFANVIAINEETGIAISTDGVGSKLLVAQMMEKYDTVGIDCVAMNANDVICVGATPIAMVDYLAVESIDEKMAYEIGKGLYEGARHANISLIGGETAQLKDMVKGYRENKGFDLAGTCVGIVALDKIISGKKINEGDAIIGLASTGLHSNGYSLAREALFKKAGYKVDFRPPGFDKSIGEELLTPTRIYCKEIIQMLQLPLNIKALINITGGGFCNLTRVDSKISFMIDTLPKPAPIFQLIQRFGSVSTEEMFKVFNMGIGFCIISDKKSCGSIMDICKKNGLDSYEIGHAVKYNPEWDINIVPEKLLVKDDIFRRA